MVLNTSLKRHFYGKNWTRAHGANAPNSSKEGLFTWCECLEYCLKLFIIVSESGVVTEFVE